jgi:two-component system cell cycle response regulator DivK
MYAEYLRAHGIDVAEAERPEHAFGQLDTAAVVVADMVFTRSGFDGPRFVRALRSTDQGTRMSVIVLSGYVRMEDRALARQSGADTFLIKPCEPQFLLEQVRRALTAYRKGTRISWNWPEESPAADASASKNQPASGDRRRSAASKPTPA